jgi:predicted O-linked N-acetylglucosamine transferase (SPINDLY family)
MMPPTPIESLLRQGLAHHAAGRLGDAEACYRQALAIDPRHADAMHFLGQAMEAAGFSLEAIQWIHQALAIRPRAEMWHNLAISLKNIGRLEEAIDCLRQAVAMDPHHSAIHSGLLYLLWFQPGLSMEEILAEHARWAARHVEPLLKAAPPHGNDRDPNRRLRVGYLSPNLRSHVVGLMLEPALREHDRSAVEIFLYSDSARLDAASERLKNCSDHWVPVAGMPDEAVAQRIRADAIDVLVDLTLHMGGNRALVFARKPAPVQVNYLAYPATSGSPAMDYRLTDPFLDPPDSPTPGGTEKLWRLPETFQLYAPHQPCPDPGPPPMLERGYPTFGALHNFNKINPAVLRLWGQILAGAGPNSRLLVTVHQGRQGDAVREFFSKNGVPVERLVMADRLPRFEYLNLYRQIDLTLDPFPYNGYTSSLDSLWMGVPVISMRGDRAVSRAGSSVLSNLGLDEFIADSPEDYASRAIGAVSNPTRLVNLRQELRGMMERSALMDAKRFARNLEAAYRWMWRDS